MSPYRNILKRRHDRKEFVTQGLRCSRSMPKIDTGPAAQRADYKEAKNLCKKMYEEQSAATGEGTSPFLLDSNVANKKINNSKAWRSMLIALIPIQAGAITLPLPHLPPLRLLSGKHAHVHGNLLHRGTLGQHEIGNRGNLHLGVNSDFFFLPSFQNECFFRLPES